MYLRFYTAFFLILIALLAAKNWFGLHFAGDETITRSMALLLAIGYVPVLLSSIREGSITVPPQTVLRHQRPLMFWLVVAVHSALMTAIAVGTLIGLLGDR